ncbi:DMT family transporter [Ottowia thiooxydans]|uniref:DMT family transporter n=1 Tax=Ottowia thiooxydans TaxID=219182 RepID=UPI000416CEE4|nr:DMT family transporter [Ottowia thiooxydans]
MTSAPATASLTPFTPTVVLEFVLLAAIWGASFMFMRQAAVEFGALPTAALRVTVAALCLLPIMLARGQWLELKKHWRPVFVCGVLNSAVPFACFSFALLHITTGLSAILNATVPLFGALVAWTWLKEPPGRSRMIGLMIGFGGVAMLAWDKASFKPAASGVASGWAVLACLLATLSYAVAASYTKKFLTGVPALTLATGSQIGAALGLALPALWYRPAVMPSLTAWGSLLALGALCTGVAYVLYFRLIEHLGPARALTVTFTIPVFALLYGATLLGEAVTPWMLLCGGVVICGTILSTGLVKLRV